MGLCDDVRCNYPLPDDPPEELRDWSTKSTALDGAAYRITAGGRLERLAGSGRFDDAYVPEMWLDQNWHGSLVFYSCTGWPNRRIKEWWEYHAVFVEGAIVNIRREAAQTWPEHLADEEADDGGA